MSNQIISTRLAELGLNLGMPAAPAANYVPYVISGNLVFISGQIPIKDGEIHFKGRLGETMDIEEGQKAARLCAVNLLSQLNTALEGDLSRVKRCVKLGGFVNSTADFDQQAAVINGASDLMVAVLGEAGRHARFAVGAPVLPFNVAVEVDGIFEIA